MRGVQASRRYGWFSQTACSESHTGGLVAARPNDLERAPIPAFPGALPRAQRETKRRFPAQLGADTLRDQNRAAPQRLPTSRPRSFPARRPARRSWALKWFWSGLAVSGRAT